MLTASPHPPQSRARSVSRSRFPGVGRPLIGVALLVLLALAIPAVGQPAAEEPLPDDLCLDCHSDPDLESESGAPIFVDTDVLGRSEHADLACVDCHSQEGADFEDLPHFPAYEPVGCIECHQRTGAIWQEYFRRMLADNGHSDIPGCKSCHGAHDARRQMGMEIVCERCHEDVAAEYKESYHFRKYKEDTRRYPICTTCHDPHFKSKKEVMSPIEYKQEIVDICSRCHRKDIETYVYSEHFDALEEGNPAAPVCTSCHEKHDIRKPAERESRVSSVNISEVCNSCHPGHAESLHRSPGTDPALISCASCHTGHQTNMVSINQAIFKEGGIFNRCNFCHSAERHTKEDLAHGQIMLLDAAGEEANCTHCHTYHWNLPGLDTEKVLHERTECINCHAAENREYKKSIHGRMRAQGVLEAPTCTDCHGEGNIRKTGEQFTAAGVIELCASCHTDREMMLGFQVNPYVVEGYKDTYHGKMFEMGATDIEFAVCTGCHGSHSILPPEDPESSVARGHIVETCKACHPRANDRFVSYLVHPKKPTAEELEGAIRPAVAAADVTQPGARTQHWVRFNNLVTAAMSLLLVGVLGVFGLHTLLWFRQGFRGRFKPRGKYYRRIDGFHRFLHVLVNVSFLTLAFTGLPQSYAHTDLAKWLFQNVMSLSTAQQLHYAAAAVTALYFLLHLGYLVLRWRKVGWRRLLTGPATMMFRKKDLTDLVAHVKWFFGKSEAPRFDRWTYWEKFDYFAVFWGVFVIGLSGLLRWNEEFFGNLLGGGVISLADTIHKDEALLATAFIFIVHFFNTHLRADKFPMDVSIYTGRLSEEELRKERPLEWQRLEAAGRLSELEVKPLGAFRTFLCYVWASSALAIGMFLLVLIILGQLTGG